MLGSAFNSARTPPPPPSSFTSVAFRTPSSVAAHNILLSGSQLMAPSTRHSGVRRISRDRVDYTIDLRADTPG
ncbi:hypothetical protein SK128_028312, partial [Halocaridina rubra]